MKLQPPPSRRNRLRWDPGGFEALRFQTSAVHRFGQETPWKTMEKLAENQTMENLSLMHQFRVGFSGTYAAYESF